MKNLWSILQTEIDRYWNRNQNWKRGASLRIEINKSFRLCEEKYGKRKILDRGIEVSEWKIERVQDII